VLQTLLQGLWPFVGRNDNREFWTHAMYSTCMQCFFLDIGSYTASLGLVTDAGATVAPLENSKDESALLPQIEKFLESHSAEFSSLTHLMAVTGPGGFMSLRTGITLMNTLQWRFGIPLAGIHLSDLWKIRVLSLLSPARPHPQPLPQNGGGEKGEGALWIHSTKKEAFFVRGFGTFAKKWQEPTLLSLTDLQKEITEETAFIGEVLDEQRQKLPMLKEIEKTQSLEDVLPDLVKTATFEKKSLLPWYGRGA